MAEIELKITHLSKADIHRRLKVIGAKLQFPETLVTDIFYAQKKQGLMQGQTVRLRHLAGGAVYLTAKRKRSGGRFKVMEESELEVASLDNAQKLLHTLGFRITSKREKLREEYRYHDVIIEIDTYPGMAPYMEIEAKNKLALLRFLQAFGLSITQTNNLSAKELIIKAQKNPDHITFSTHDHSLPSHLHQKKVREPGDHQKRRTYPASTAHVSEKKHPRPHHP